MDNSSSTTTTSSSTATTPGIIDQNNVPNTPGGGEPMSPLASGETVSRLTTRQIQRRVRQAALDTYLAQSSTESSLAEFVVDRHGSQLPYDRHLWGNLWRRRRWGDNVDIDLTKEKLDPPLLDALRLSVQRLGECVEEIKSSGKMLEQLSFKSFPVDLGDDAVNAWVTSRGTTVDALIEAQGAPPTLNVNNFLEALTEGGILLNAGNPDYDPKPFNLLSPGKSDTRRLHLEIAGKPVHVKRCRTTLAIPLEILPVHVRVPKVGIFEFNANVSLLLFYQGFGKRRIGKGEITKEEEPVASGVMQESSSTTTSSSLTNANTAAVASSMSIQATPNAIESTPAVVEEPLTGPNLGLPGWFLSARPLAELPFIWGPSTPLAQAKAMLFHSGVNDQLYILLTNESKQVEEGTLLRVAGLVKCTEIISVEGTKTNQYSSENEVYQPRKRARLSEFGATD